MKYCLQGIFCILFVCGFMACSEDDPLELNYEKVFIEYIEINAISNYENWDSPGRPDLFFELILEPATFVTTSEIKENAELPVIWDQEMQLIGGKEASYFLRFIDRDVGVIDEQIFAATLRPSLAFPETVLNFNEGGNEMEIKLRFE